VRITFDTSGLDAQRARLAEARAALPGMLQDAVREAGDWVKQNLGDGAPVGEQEGPPPQGDGPGRLSESFSVQDESSAFSPGAAISVRTTQPQKLDWVVNGRGEVLPINKRALFWPGLAHPIRRAGPSQPNDFVTPALAEMPDAEEVLGVVVEQLAEIIGA
jgi:hypothetical protein